MISRIAAHRQSTELSTAAHTRLPWARLAALAGGTAAMGSGVTLLLWARLGLVPLDILHLGAAHILGSTIGGGIIAVQALALLAYLPLRIRPGVGTIAAFLVPAVVVDLLLPLLPTLTSLIARIGVFALGGVLFCFGVATYLAADLGRIPRDAIMGALAGERRGKPASRRRIARVRVGIDLTCVVAGALLLGPANALRTGALGFGSLVLVCGCGPLIAFLWPRLVRVLGIPTVLGDAPGGSHTNDAAEFPGQGR